ncbi:hypothetical protein AMJ74_06605 [candidate division WOR_3 bacterium SM1_77]|uniref:Uncharacterized protein n=1 Tax=candidate division WOR_3 bacterium SM1_77 TaxID=1703778 RepID=A0A0S8JSP1_UNCW3|nr:MAG: hypothetical protein AMJ74_06605 [candidate division WOR_3 bacterium SM1_77]
MKAEVRGIPGSAYAKSGLHRDIESSPTFLALEAAIDSVWPSIGTSFGDRLSLAEFLEWFERLPGKVKYPLIGCAVIGVVLGGKVWASGAIIGGSVGLGIGAFLYFWNMNRPVIRWGSSSLFVEELTSWDPNAKACPSGFGDAHFVSLEQTFQYVVYFENVDSATASAEDITIIDTLDTNLDWSTLSFDTTSHVPTSMDFDTLTGVITWIFEDINLPPNQDPPEGEGWVSFTIKPKQDLSSGTQVKNDAWIVFDFNPPMSTGDVLNTIDALPPTSTVLPLPDTTQYWQFEVHWSGADDSLGSGVRNYTTYVSDNGEPYFSWVMNTTDTMAIFEGEDGHTYSFYSIAVDNVGHHEAPPDTLDAVITIDNAAPDTFSLLEPADSTWVDADTTDSIYFDWSDSYDPDPFLYCLYLSPDSTFTDTITTIIFDSLEESEYTLMLSDSTKFFEEYSPESDFADARFEPERHTKDIVKEVSREKSLDGSQQRENANQLKVNRKSQTDIIKKDMSNTIIKASSRIVHEEISRTENSFEFSEPTTYSRVKLIQDTTYYWKVKAYDEWWAYTWSNQTWRFLFFTDIGTVEYSPTGMLPKALSLHQNYPNPFCASTAIRYALPPDESSGQVHVLLKIYDSVGRLVRTLVNEAKQPGYYTVNWDNKDSIGRRVGAGIYFYRIEVGEFASTKKMILLR